MIVNLSQNQIERTLEEVLLHPDEASGGNSHFLKCQRCEARNLILEKVTEIRAIDADPNDHTQSVWKLTYVCPNCNTRNFRWCSSYTLYGWARQFGVYNDGLL